MQVRSPDGTQWNVRRRWLPRHENVGRKLLRKRAERRQARRVAAFQHPKPQKKEDSGWGDLAMSPLDLLDDLFWVVLVVAAIGFVLFWGWPFLVALLDVLFVVVLAIVGVVARVAFRRPWLVEATGGEARLSRSVVGWRASSRMVGAWADELRHGRGLEPPVL